MIGKKGKQRKREEGEENSKVNPYEWTKNGKEEEKYWKVKRFLQ